MRIPKSQVRFSKYITKYEPTDKIGIHNLLGTMVLEVRVYNAIIINYFIILET